jgi:hypothetical protein
MYMLSSKETIFPFNILQKLTIQLNYAATRWYILQSSLILNEA